MSNNSVISSLYIKNFKGFGDATTLQLAPITLILGANSSGKSSVLQGLRLLSAVSRSGGVSIPWDRDDLQLVSHRYSSHEHVGGQISLGIAGPIADPPESEPFDGPPDEEWLDWRWSFTVSMDETIRNVRFSHPKVGVVSLAPVPRAAEAEVIGPIYLCEPFETIALLASRYSWRVPSSQDDAVEILTKWMRRVSTRIRGERASTGYRSTLLPQFESVVAETLRQELRRPPWSRPEESAVMAVAWLLRCRLQFLIPRAPMLEELGLSSEHGSIVDSELRELLDQLFPSFHGLARSATQLEALEVQKLRAVLASQLARALTSVRVLENYGGISPVADLSRAANSLREAVFLGPSRDVPRRSDLTSLRQFESQDSRAGQFARLNSEHLLARVNRDIEALELSYELVFARVENVSTPWLDGGKMLCLRDQHGTVLGLQDVGFGVGQVLPIIIALHDSKLLLVEQPELHLHPRLQASLIEIAARRIKENGGQLIFETHSEHMVHRLGRLIRTNVLDPTDVSIIALSRDASGPRRAQPIAQRIRLDQQGWPLDPWPPGFFYDDLDDLLPDTQDTADS